MASLKRCWLLGLLVAWASASGQGILIPASFYAAEGAPFTVTIGTHWELDRPVGPKQGTQRILRDSAGRQRYEAPIVDGVPRSATVGIYDVVASRYIKLDLDAKTAEVSPMRVGRTVSIDVTSATSIAPVTAAADQTLLGTREIAGLEAWGQRTVKTVSLMGRLPMVQDRELWLSTHYRLPLMQVMRSERGKITQTVVSFVAGEPDAALFQIPPGFKVSDAPPPPEPAPGTVRIGNGVSEPLVLKMAYPEFSEEARRKKVNGNVLVSLVVDENGLPQNVKVVRGLGLGLDEKAVEAVKQYRFKPAMREGVPVKVELNVEVNFQIS